MLEFGIASVFSVNSKKEREFNRAMVKWSGSTLGLTAVQLYEYFTAAKWINISLVLCSRKHSFCFHAFALSSVDFSLLISLHFVMLFLFVLWLCIPDEWIIVQLKDAVLCVTRLPFAHQLKYENCVRILQVPKAHHPLCLFCVINLFHSTVWAHSFLHRLLEVARNFFLQNVRESNTMQNSCYTMISFW